MDIVQSFTVCLKKYCSTEGRASRSEFWWFAVPTGLFHFAQNLSVSYYIWGVDEFALYHLLHLIAAIVVAIPDCTVAVRRMHDVNGPSVLGWLGGISTICLLYAFSLGSSLVLGLDYSPFGAKAQENILGLSTLFWIACLICSLIFLAFSLARGTPGPNDYGPDPLEVKQTEPAAGYAWLHTAPATAVPPPEAQPPYGIAQNGFVQNGFTQVDPQAPAAPVTPAAPTAAPAQKFAPAQASAYVQAPANQAPAPQAYGAYGTYGAYAHNQLPPNSAYQADPLNQQQLAQALAYPDEVPQVSLNAAELAQRGYVELTPEQSWQLQALLQVKAQRPPHQP